MNIITPKHIIERVPVKSFHGDVNGQISKIVGLDSFDLNESSLYWCSDKNKENLLNVDKGFAIVSEGTYAYLEEETNHLNNSQISWIVVENPRLAFMQVLKEFYVPKPELGLVHPSATIDSSAHIDINEVNIGANVVIEKDVVLGKNVVIDHNTVVRAGTIIENDVRIGANCTIGGVGFGYEINESGEYEVIPHIGNVLIHSGVEIGNNVCVDKAVLGSTVLGENVKIDNLVHIAHGVKIGKNSLVIANSMIAGSTIIGENVWVSPSASVIQKTVIGDNALVGMGSVVLKDVDPNTIVAGIPAKKIKDKK
jgi:UDP-3-O-[3-hydroxymyristoyl] glucosamine N-acyltransferase